ncbi:MAG: hypothetical protein RQ748_00685, partial [Elusimicrobiales bacterium]|nr:hypothetical protein [Elusimicrobiales bacterium]
MQKDPTRSRTLLYALPSDFAGWRRGGRAAAAPGAFPVLRGGPAGSVLTSPPVPAPLPFDRLVLSVNARVTGAGTLRAEVSVLRGKWSPWFAMADLGSSRGASVPSIPRPEGEVGQDLLSLKKKASALRVRFRFTGPASSR